MAIKIDQIQHPEYSLNIKDWEKWRHCYEGGDDFKNRYLKILSSRESTEDFERRKEIAPIPRFSGAAVDEVANSITVRLPDVKRVGGPNSYREACEGKNGGVDRRGLTMNGFLAQYVLPEMLSMRECIVFVDKEQIRENGTKADEIGKNPYIYYYAVEDIMSWDWRYHNGCLSYKTLLLRENYSTVDDETGLPAGTAVRYLRMWIDKRNKVSAQYYLEEEHDTPEGKQKGFWPQGVIELKIDMIPVVQFAVSKSLLQDTADHQIALLNMESTDVSYAYGANFPFYTEQYHPNQQASHLKVRDPQTGEEKEVKEKVTGILHGRQYPYQLERPGFIHPSSEPLEISMKKQRQIKDDIRALTGLSVATLQPGHASAESKGVDNQTLEAGLAQIGIVLQIGEQRISDIWAKYQGEKESTNVIYPTNYTLVTEPQRLDRAKNLKELQGSVPSKKFAKEVGKEIAATLFDGKVPLKTMDAINAEVDAADHITSNSEDIERDLEMGLVSEETASNARGYDGKKEVPKAREEHAERAKRILMAQTSAGGKAGPQGSSGSGDPQARGVADVSADPSAGEKEKDVSQSSTLNPDKAKKVRS
jgi:hypothetical protein